MRNYELTCILDANLANEELARALESIIAFIQGKGGILLSQDVKGKKELLAPIKSHREGTVAVLRFTMDASHVGDMEKHLKENTKVLRSLCLIARTRRTKDKTPHLVPSLGSSAPTLREQSFGSEAQDRRENTETKPMDLGEIDKKLEEIFKQP